MGECSITDQKDKKILNLIKSYPLYHDFYSVDDTIKIKIPNNNFLLSIIENNQKTLYDHYEKFIKYQNQLLKNNPILYQQFFYAKYNNDKNLFIKELKNQDIESFLYFFNKREYTSLSIENTEMNFPLFLYEKFPFNSENLPSSLKICKVSSSIIELGTSDKNYSFISGLEELEFFFCKISTIPEDFCILLNLKKLNLRRNNLYNLPDSFDKLINIEELNLADNQFTELPRQILRTNKALILLDLSGNQLEDFNPIEVANDIKLKSLFLAHNKLINFPLIQYFPYIQYVNLDENLISEIPINLNYGLKINVIINILRNKGINKVIEINCSKTKDSDNDNQNKSTKETIYDFLKITKPKTELEINISEYVENLLKNKAIPDEEDHNLIPYLEIKKYIYLVEEVKKLIVTGKEDQIAEVQNMNLKKDLKKAYNTYLKLKEYKDTLKKPDMMDLEMLEKNYFEILYQLHKEIDNQNLNDKNKLDSDNTKNKDTIIVIPKKNTNFDLTNDKIDKIIKSVLYKQKNINDENDILASERYLQKNEKSKENNENVNFLRKLSNLLTKSKTNLILQYAGNIDNIFQENLQALWQEKDVNSLILISTELQILVEELINFYKKEGRISVQYTITKYEKNEDEDDIFLNNKTLEILNKIGSSERKRITKDNMKQTLFIFTIDKKIFNKLKYFNCFLYRFIETIKNNNDDPIFITLNE